MRPEEAELALIRIAAAAQRVAALDERLRRLARDLLEFPTDDQAFLVQAIGARVAEEPACGPLVLLLADVGGFRAALGPEGLDRLRQALGRHPQGAAAERYLRQASPVDPTRLPLLRAKTGVVLQTVSMINDRLETKRLPQLKVDGYEMVERVASLSGLGDARVRVDLSELSRPALEVAREVLLEADFEEGDDDASFETQVTDEQVATLGQASGLGRVVGAGKVAALSEAVAQRQGLLLIKRFCLLCRSATMYPPEHPSLPPTFEAFRAMVERAIEGREQITFTVLGVDVLLDDVKIRKEDRFKKAFADLFDERQVSSVTFRSGFTVDEVRALVACFTENLKTVRDSGGVRALLGRRGITSILVDQFKYRVVSDDGTVSADAYPGADRLLEGVIYTHVLEKLEREGFQSLSVEEVGAFFKDLLTSPDEDRRRALARLLLTLDPGLLETGFLTNPEVRKSLSWSAARKLLDVSLRDLAGSDHETREQALETVAQIGDLAVTRKKEATVTLIARELIGYATTQETDPDVLRKAIQVPAAMAAAYVKRRRLDKASGLVQALSQVARGEREISLGSDTPALPPPPDGAVEVRTAAREALAAMGRDVEVVDLLVQALADPDATRNRLASGLLEALGTDLVISRTFRLFLDLDRSVRSRGYRLLGTLGRQSRSALRHEIEERRLPTHPGRDPASGLLQPESEWYILRNCMDLLVEIDPTGAAPLILDLSQDPDPRVRRESLRLIARHALPESGEALRLGLADPRAEVREAAIAGVGAFRDEGALDALVTIVFRHPEHRKLALEALGAIGSVHCADFLLTALDAIDMTRAQRRRRKKTRVIRDFPVDQAAILQAIAALGAIGGLDVENRLEEFLDHWSSPLRRLPFRSKRGVPREEFLAAARNALALARRRKPTAPAEPPGPVPPVFGPRRRRWPGALEEDPASDAERGAGRT